MSMVGNRLPEREAQAFSRLYNETNAIFAKTSNGRFIPVATVPMQFSRAAVEELDYAVNTLGIRMVEIGTNINGLNLDERIVPTALRSGGRTRYSRAITSTPGSGCRKRAAR